ncbi:GTP cyclohydrolase I FolE [Celerinatantimonas sp. MCCC 1A17872]|uniref:GTP cyclohydrolase I FolE n=1 Tax=Celerinatantimonas sp. MCCC 1A17872 TaxID=3177514 RepID=UPI0038C575AF
MNEISNDALNVQKALVAAGIETPSIQNTLESSEKIAQIGSHFQEILNILGMDLTDDSLTETPHRIAKMYVQEIFQGLDYRNFPKITLIDNKMDVDEMVTVKNIGMISTCEHHFAAIDGFAHVAYIPKGKVIGLSKINRVVRFFAQRPQVQERLTRQILIALQTILHTQDVAVRINAVHYCVKSRGVADHSSDTTTTALGGGFKTNLATRQEFLHQLKV